MNFSLAINDQLMYQCIDWEANKKEMGEWSQWTADMTLLFSNTVSPSKYYVYNEEWSSLYDIRAAFQIWLMVFNNTD